MTEETHNIGEVPPIPVNGNGRILKSVWLILGFIVTIAVASIGATNYFSNNFVSKEIYNNDKNTLSDQINKLSANIQILTTSINNLNSKLSYIEGRNSK